MNIKFDNYIKVKKRFAKIIVDYIKNELIKCLEIVHFINKRSIIVFGRILERKGEIMNRIKILQLIVTASVITSGVCMSKNIAKAAEVDTTTNILTSSILDVKEDNESTKVIGQVINVNTNLRVRSEADSNSQVLGYLLNDDKVNIIEELDEWYKIEYKDTEGYVNKEYVSVESKEEVKEDNEKVDSSTTDQETSSNLQVEDKSDSKNINVDEDKEVVVMSASNRKGKVINVTSNLRIRSGAGTNCSVIGYLNNGTELIITGESGNWYAINHNGQTGYVSKDYVQVIDNPSSNTSSSNRSGNVVNITSYLNVRSGAGTNHSVIGHLNNGAGVTITGESGNWYAISYNGQTGYVSKDYISVSSSSNNTSPSQPTTSNRSGKVVNVTSNLRVRSGASTSSSVLGYLINGASVTITGENGNWYVISYNGGTGYVSKDYISVTGASSSAPSRGEEVNTTNKTGYVVNVTSNLRVRSAASTSSSVLGYLINGASVTITGESGNWYSINYSGKTGYVCKDYISLTANGGSSTNNSSSKYETILNAMKAHIGTPYVWGGSGELLTTASLNRLRSIYPNANYSRAAQYVNKGYRAFDCSGLMQWGFAQAGISIGRSTWDQISAGHEVSLSNLQPGDLLFYSNLTHVGMYVGNGQWIESPNSNANIRITSVPWGSVTRARRVLS